MSKSKDKNKSETKKKVPFDFPLSKYKYVVLPEQKKVTAISTYEGKTVKGVAKCAPTDTFDEEMGKKLAAARCNMKITIKRVKRAIELCEFSELLAASAEDYADHMVDYYEDAADAMIAASDRLEELMEIM